MKKQNKYIDLKNKDIVNNAIGTNMENEPIHIQSAFVEKNMKKNKTVISRWIPYQIFYVFKEDSYDYYDIDIDNDTQDRLLKFFQALFLVKSPKKLELNVSYVVFFKIKKEHKFYSICTRQENVIFTSWNAEDRMLKHLFKRIVDYLIRLFENYYELDNSCDAVLLEFIKLEGVQFDPNVLLNRKEVKKAVSTSTYRDVSRSFTLVGGFNTKAFNKLNSINNNTINNLNINIGGKKSYSTTTTTTTSTTTTITTNSTGNSSINSLRLLFGNIIELKDFLSTFEEGNRNNKPDYSITNTTEFETFRKGKRIFVKKTDFIKNEIHTRVFSQNGNLLEYCIDKQIKENLFTRSTKGLIMFFNNCNELLQTVKKVLISPIKIRLSKTEEKEENNTTSKPNIGTLDIETTCDNHPICFAIGFYSTRDSKPKIYYIDDKDLDKKDLDSDKKYLASDKLIHKCISELLRPKYTGIVFYVHNFGKFDAVFILKALLNFNLTKEGKENPYIISNLLTRENDILKLVIKRKIKNKQGKYVTRSVTFMDSYAVLTRSLDDLCKDYKLNQEESKLKFPHLFSTMANLWYKGRTPDISYYEKGMKHEDYNKLITENWDFKGETVKYLNLDLISLHSILIKINKTVKFLFNINLTDCVTASSLAGKIFFNRFYDEKNKPIPLIKNPTIYNDIKQAYYGGRVEVYKPTTDKPGQKLYYYDVNSLYPFASLKVMPGINCEFIQFFKDIKTISDDLFGFFYCKIKCDDNRYLGLLPVRLESGLTFPYGEWEGWYFSEELKFAKENGYDIQVIKGYQFDKVTNIFDNFVNTLMKIKQNPKTPTEKNLAKLILNSLIGKFGMDIYQTITSILSEDDLQTLVKTTKVKDTTQISEDVYLVVHENVISKEICDETNQDYISLLNEKGSTENSINSSNNVSITTAAATLAYARIHMGKQMLDILNRGGKLYYTDTDSIVTDIELSPDSIHDSELGKFKLEHITEKALFVADKTYVLISDKIDPDTKKNIIVKRAKSVNSKFLEFKNYEDLYNNIQIQVDKTNSYRNYKDGYVRIATDKVDLNPITYLKRKRLFKRGTNKWVDSCIINYNEYDNIS